MQTKTFLKKIAATSAAVAMLFSATPTFAASNTNLQITIAAGTLGIDIVDATGATVATPAVAMSATAYSFANQTSTGTLGTATEKIRVSNPTATVTWNAAIAATGGNAVTWSDGGTNIMDFNAPGAAQLSVDPSAGTIVAGNGVTTGVSVGAASAFDQGITDSITLFSAATGAATYDRFDLTGVGLSQVIPASQTPAAYTLNLTLTVV